MMMGFIEGELEFENDKQKLCSYTTHESNIVIIEKASKIEWTW